MARPNPQREVMWNTDFEPLTPMFWRHMACIQVGGRWKKPNGEFAGMGNFYHYKEAQKILWPEKEWHRWNDLLLEKFLEHRIIGVLGPASSGKTFEAATFALIFYYSHSDCTTVLVSSTEREMLEMRVWGEIKKAHKLAMSRMHGLPGILVESRQRLVTDDRSVDSEGRDFRNGVCFPGETLIDTPNGKCRIDEVRIGQEVLNASGIGTVTRIFSNQSPTLVRVKLSDNRTIDCTPEHPFFTQRGWVNAIDLETFDTVFSQDEAMQILRKADSEQYNILLGQMQAQETVQGMRENGWIGLPKQSVLFSSMQGPHRKEEVRSVRENVQGMEEKGLVDGEYDFEILLNLMRWEMGRNTQGVFFGDKNDLQALRENNAESPSREKVLLLEVHKTQQLQDLLKVRKAVSVRKTQTKIEPLEILRSRMQGRNSGTTHHLGFISEIHNGAPSGEPLHRRGVSADKVSGRSGWGIPQGPKNKSEGCAASQGIEGTRVDSVKILESRGDSRFDEGEGGYRVYNISVSGHPSYSVNGALVHNCGVACKKGGSYVGLSSFIGIKNKHILLVADEGAFMPRAYVDAISNLNKNKGFKCIVLGNPKETTDALGVICEPSAELGGWDGGIDQTPKTKTWPTRFKDGICVQLVGSDCPNMDAPKDAPVPYPFLITREAIESDVAFYGMDSIQYSMMNEGRMPRGQGLRRVITRAMCLKFGAMEPPIWKSDERTRIGFLDAAYGSVGGDRCVFGEMQIGKDPNDREILAVIETMLVPVTTTNPELPEDQIAIFVKTQCEQRHIKPENLFFDSTGRGSLVGAFARLWSANVGTVEFGGNPSERYVSDNIRVRCKDYYSKFVTELWYSVRLTVESRQFRGMSEDMLMEGSMREWGFVGGGKKIEIESKEDMKKKAGRSPDLFDALACGVEGARRRGFHIAKLTNVGETADNGWRLDLAKRMERLKQRHTLNYVS